MSLQHLQDQFLRAPNSSNGFQLVMLALIKQYTTGGRLCFLSEPEEVLPALQDHFGETYDISVSSRDIDGTDFCVRGSMPQKAFDIVAAQSLLEHTCRPSILVENMVDAVVPGGYVVLQHPFVGFGYHAYPVDCVRVFADFYKDLQRYLPYTLETFLQYGESNYIVLKRETD